MSATHTLKAGSGYDYGCNNFARAMADTPVRLAPKEHARPCFIIAYIVGGEFDGRRIHTQKQLIREGAP